MRKANWAGRGAIGEGGSVNGKREILGKSRGKNKKEHTVVLYQKSSYNSAHSILPTPSKNNT
jgi:hypothetical protein